MLTQLSLFWFDLLKDVVPNHIDRSGTPVPALERYARDLEGRSMIVAKTDPLPVECVVRGYVAGSAWKDYRATGAVCGITLPPRAPGIRPARAAGLHALDQGGRGPRREHLVRPHGGDRGRRSRGGAPDPDPRPVLARARPRRSPRHHPRRHQAGVRDPRRPRGVDRRGLHARTRPASGRRTGTRPAGRSRASTSSSFATTSRASRGTSGRRPLPCRPKSSPARARSTSRHTLA